MENNDIHTIEYENEEQLISFPVNLSLAGNALNCDCKTWEFVKILTNQAKLGITRIDYKNMTCRSPEELKGQTLDNILPKMTDCFEDLYKCPDKCTCDMRRNNELLYIDCSYRGMGYPPRISFHSKEFEIFLDLAHNSLRKLPILLEANNGIIGINASYNLIEKVRKSNIPESLKVNNFLIDPNKNIMYIVNGFF